MNEESHCSLLRSKVYLSQNTVKIACSFISTPQLDRSITTTNGKSLPIRTECHTVNDVWMLSDGAHFLTSCHVPQYDLINTATGKSPAIRTKRHTVNRDSDGAHFLTSCHVPQLDRHIIAATGKGLAIRTKRYTDNPRCMLSEGAHLTSCQVPKL